MHTDTKGEKGTLLIALQIKSNYYIMAKKLNVNGIDYKTSYSVYSVIHKIDNKNKINVLFDTEEDASDYFQKMVDIFLRKYPNAIEISTKHKTSRYGQTTLKGVSYKYETEYGNKRTTFFAYKHMNVYTQEA